MEEINNEEIGNEELTGGEYTYHTDGGDTAIEIPHRMFVALGRIFSVSRREDANEVAGHKMTRDELKRRFITAVAQNGKIMSEKERKKEERRQAREQAKEEKKQVREQAKEEKKQAREQKKEEKKQVGEENKKKFKAKYLIPIIIPFVLLAGARACAEDGATRIEEEPEAIVETEEPTEEREDEDRTITITRTETIPIDLTIYDIDNPSMILEGLVNSSGQEGLTANNIEGQGIEGQYYSGEQQFREEEKAVEGVADFQVWKQIIDANMEILSNPDATTEEKQQAIQEILKIEQEICQTFANNQEMAEQHTTSFATSSEAFRDSHTDSEELAVNLLLEKYMQQFGLSSENVAQLEIIRDLIEKGYQITITSARQEKDGDYRITGTGIIEVTEEIVISEAAQTWQGLVKYTKETTRETRETEEITGEERN